MSTHYVARLNQELFFFYPSANMTALCCRIWREGRFLPETTLHTGIRLPFTVFHQQGQLHIFCRDNQNSTLLFTRKNDEWHNRTILQKGASANGENILLTPILSDDGLCILYNGFDDSPCLFKRNMTGEWQQAESIDYFRPFSFVPYVAQNTGPGHTVLFYQNQADDCQVGYREVTPKRTGSFHRFLNVKGSLVDASFLTTIEEVHILMIVKAAFSHQLLYRKRTDDVFTPPILLWESPKIEQCLLTIIGSEIHATCMVGGKLHLAISKNNGDSFESIELYKRKFCAEPIKANFVSETFEPNWFARQVYVDQAAPWDVQMLPDLLRDFYPWHEESDKMRELQNRLNAAEKALDAKDRQIMELLYQSKSEKQSSGFSANLHEPSDID